MTISRTKSPYYLLAIYEEGYSVDEISDSIDYVYNFGTAILNADFRLYDSQGRQISFVSTKVDIDQVPSSCAFNGEINPESLGIEERVTEPSETNVELIKRSLIASIILRYNHTIFRSKNILKTDDLNGLDAGSLTSIYKLSNRKLRKVVTGLVSRESEKQN
jgi:hypothetical protein